MRVYHIISGDLWAGAEVMACHLLKHLHRCADLQVSVALLNNGRLADELKSAGLEVEIIDEQQYAFPSIVKKIRKKIINGSKEPRIIHAHRYKENIIAWLASLGMPYCHLVSTQHGLPEATNQNASRIGRLKTEINFYLLKHRFKRVVAVSQDIKTWFVAEMNFAPDRLDVVRNGIEYLPQPNSCKTVKPFCIGSSGRLFPVKDYPLMVDICEKLAEEKDLFFTLAGEGPERSHLEAMITKSGLEERFALEGHLDDMESFYNKLSLYVNTSVHEGIPLTILEAMAHGLPIVAPRVGGIPEVVEDGVEGFLISNRSAENFADKCRLLARNKELHANMSMAARSKFENAFTVDRMVEQYQEIYKNIIRR